MNPEALMTTFRRRMTEKMHDPTEAVLICGLFAHFLAEQLYGATLADGRPLYRCDIMGMKEFLTEVAISAVDPESTKLSGGTRTGRDQLGQRLLHESDPCPRCGHVHQGDRECGEQIGGGRICRCEMEVPA
jgi:hypothetical protein